LQHHRARVAARHEKTGRVRAGVYPRPPTNRPTITRLSLRLPTIHGHDLAIDIQPQPGDEPKSQLAHGQPVPHRHGSRSHETLGPRAQCQALYRPSDRIGAIQYPHGLARLGRLLQHISQRRDERVDTAAQVLEIHQEHVERVHHLSRWSTHLPVKTEYWDVV